MSAGFNAHCQSFGQGARRALAIHCTLAHSGAWRGLGDALADDLTLVAFDLPGHGKSNDWDGQCDLHRLCTDTALGYLIEPMDVIGHSFGATVALRLAVEQPHLVRSLTLIEPVFFAAARRDAPAKARAHEEETAPCFTALAQGDTALAARRFNRFWGDGTRWENIPEVTRRYLSDRMHLVPAQTPAILDDNAQLMAPGMLGRADMPGVLVQGQRSPEIIDAIHESLAARLPNTRRAWIAGAGHMCPLTHPLAVADEIRGLLEMAEE
ncbi:alpha/beta fold hydrolase [Roseobacter weihaiensis]|uniref:alpha/beta fold hydrolase n=1 Tax=Roseobacter weihaiensis TaxID=2763262 RepID=UPI001D0B607C|nr:alpha/beta hydrolase [Roseobacter sp. H9]